jgi:hypothetical protein
MGSKIFSLWLLFLLWSRVSYKSISLSIFTEQQAVKQSIPVLDCHLHQKAGHKWQQTAASGNKNCSVTWSAQEKYVELGCVHVDRIAPWGVCMWIELPLRLMHKRLSCKE